MDDKTKENKFLYLNIKDKILEKYKNKPYFTPLQSERELCDEYDVSRPTIRKALDILEQQGIIRKINGKGAVYLGKENFIENFSNNENHAIISFYENVSLHGNYTKSKVLRQSIEPAKSNIAAALNIEEKTLVFHLERLREINGEVYSIADAYIPYKTCPELLEKDFTSASLYNTLEEFGIYIYKADKTVQIGEATQYESLHLNIKEGEYITITQGIAKDINDNIIEYTVSKAPAKKMRIETTVYNDKWKHKQNS